jgi:hypothetical protein
MQGCFCVNELLRPNTPLVEKKNGMDIKGNKFFFQLYFIVISSICKITIFLANYPPLSITGVGCYYCHPPILCHLLSVLN